MNGRRFKILGVLGLLCLSGLQACQGEESNLPERATSYEAHNLALPTTLSQSYQLAFAEVPQLTAERFLAAYDNFSESGSVTRERVLDHAHMQTALEHGYFLGQILTMDMNGDNWITVEERNIALSLPGWRNKPAFIERVLDFDSDQDGAVSLKEARDFSRFLRARSGAGKLRPIEDFLMLADLDTDNIVTRNELEIYLNWMVEESESFAQAIQDKGAAGSGISGVLPR